jgi:hypothetical protein
VKNGNLRARKSDDSGSRVSDHLPSEHGAERGSDGKAAGVGGEGDAKTPE